MDQKHGNSANPREPVKLAVTGGVGSGKSTVCQRLQDLGVPVYSADQLAREAVAPGTTAYKNIVSHFGDDILLADGQIDRARLRRVISGDPEAKQTLEGFVHPEVINQMIRHLESARKNGEPVVGVEVPLLFEAGLQDFFDCVITVSVDRETRIQRIMQRDRVSHDDAEALMRIQMPEAEKRRLSDFVIDNNGSVAEVAATVDRLYDKVMEGLKKKGENS